MPLSAESILPPPSKSEVAAVLNDAADLISDPNNWVKDYSARGYNPPELVRGKPDHPPGSCLPTGEHATRWNALGALWRTALTAEAAVKAAHGFFMQAIGGDVSVNRWCAAHDQPAQVDALRRAAALAEAA